MVSLQKQNEAIWGIAQYYVVVYPITFWLIFIDDLNLIGVWSSLSYACFIQLCYYMFVVYRKVNWPEQQAIIKAKMARETKALQQQYSKNMEGYQTETEKETLEEKKDGPK